MKQYINKGLKSLVTTAIALALSACSGSGGSNSTESSPASTTDFSFTIEEPTFTNDSSQVSQLLLPILNEIKQVTFSNAYAASDVLTSNIHIVKVNADGEIIELIKPSSPITQQADKSYKFSVAGGKQSNIVIVIDLKQKLDITIGKKLNAANYLYHPIVDDKEIIVNLGSSVAFDIFIEEIEEFSTISSIELDRIIDSAQLRLKDAGLEEKDYVSLLSSIRSNIQNQVRTNTTLAIRVDDSNVIMTGSDATIEEDRASIKALFDEANTLYSLRDEFIKYDNGDVSNLDTLASQSEEARKALEQAETALRALSNVELVLNEFIRDTQIGSDKKTKDISSLFSQDNLSQLSGVIEYDENGASILINGRYNQVIFDQVTASVASIGQDAHFNLSGALDSPTAKLIINSGKITTNSDLASAGFLLTEQAQNTYAEKINAYQVVLDLELVTKNEIPASFKGDLAISGVRSTENYIKYIGDDTESIFNIKDAKLKGELSLASSSINLDVEFTAPNASTFIPNNQNYEEGKVYSDIVNYSYNGVDKFSLYTPTTNYDYFFKKKKFNNLLVVKEDSSGNREDVYAYIRNSFIETIQRKNFYFWRSQAFNIEGSDLLVGEHSFSKEVNGESIDVSYNLEANQLTFDIVSDEGILNEVYSYNSDESGLVVVKTYAENVNYPQYNSNNITFYSNNYSNFTDYIKELHLYIRKSSDGCDSYYTVDSSLLVPESSAGTLIINKSSWDNCSSTDQSVTVNYSLTTDEFIFDVDNQFGKYQKYRVHSNTITERDSIERVRTYADTNKDFQVIYLNKEKGFEDFLSDEFEIDDGCTLGFSSSCGAFWFSENNIGSLYIGYNSLEIVENKPLSAFVVYLDDPDAEGPNNFRLYDATANVEMYLDILGKTNIAAEIGRTGYDDALYSLSIAHTDLQQTESGLTVLFTLVGGKADQFVVMGSTGITLNLSDYDEGDVRTLVYGKETATVQKTDLGLKLSFSDGTFYNY